MEGDESVSGAATAAELIAIGRSLRADLVMDDAKRILSRREYDVWRHTEIDGWTVYRTASALGIGARSVAYALRRARLALGEWRVCEREGQVRLGLTIVEGGQPKFATDATLTAAHRHTRGILTGRVMDALGDIEADLDEEGEALWKEAA